MSDWQECKLEDVAEVQTGPFGSQLHLRDYKFTGTPIVTVEHIGDNRIIHSDLPFVGEEDRTRLIKYSLKTGDVIFSRVGSVDRCAYIHESENGWMFSGRLLRVRSKEKKVNSRFLSFYFSQESFKETIRRIAVGATMPSINTEILSSVNILLPPLPEQRAIATVLSSLDDKIDLLNRQNKTLEGLAATLWRKMFVEDAEPNWEEVRFGELVELQRGISYHGNQLGKYGIGLPIHNLNSIDTTGSYKYEGIKFYTGDVKEKQKLKPGDLLIVNTDITQNNRIIGWPIFVPDCFVSSTFTHHLYSASLLSDKISKLYLYFLLRYRDYRDILASSANGTTVSMLAKEAIYNLRINIPPSEVRKAFEETASAILDKQSINQTEILTITTMRDSLLPKLMSGEVRVKTEIN